MADTATETITCPECKRTLQVPASYYGQMVQCPECRRQFVAKASSVQSTPPAASSRPAPEDDYDDEPPPRRRRNEYDDDDHDIDDMLHIGQSSTPHRGGLILAMGLLALILFPYTTIICGPMAWVMGNNDLREIRAGRMDPSGEGLVQAGRILGVISTILISIGVVFFCGIIGLFITAG